RLCLLPRGHAQQIADAHRLEVGARLGRYLLGKELHYLVVQAQFPFRDGQPYGRRGETLAQRIERVRRLSVIGGPPALRHHVAMAHEHEAVHRVDLFVDRLPERQHGCRGDALCLGIAAWQTCSQADSTTPGSDGDHEQTLHTGNLRSTAGGSYWGPGSRSSTSNATFGHASAPSSSRYSATEGSALW